MKPLDVDWKLGERHRWRTRRDWKAWHGHRKLRHGHLELIHGAGELIHRGRMLDQLAPTEREVDGPAGSSFLARLQPYRTMEDRIAGVVLTFVDITARRQAEDALRENAARQSFLVTLSDRLRGVSDKMEIQALAADLLGAHLKVNQAHYGETVGEYVHISHSYSDGLTPMTGEFHADDFGKRLQEGYRSGKCRCATTRQPILFSPRRKDGCSPARTSAPT